MMPGWGSLSSLVNDLGEGILAGQLQDLSSNTADLPCSKRPWTLHLMLLLAAIA